MYLYRRTVVVYLCAYLSKTLAQLLKTLAQLLKTLHIISCSNPLNFIPHTDLYYLTEATAEPPPTTKHLTPFTRTSPSPGVNFGRLLYRVCFVTCDRVKLADSYFCSYYNCCTYRVYLHLLDTKQYYTVRVRKEMHDKSKLLFYSAASAVPPSRPGLL